MATRCVFFGLGIAYRHISPCLGWRQGQGCHEAPAAVVPFHRSCESLGHAALPCLGHVSGGSLGKSSPSDAEFFDMEQEKTMAIFRKWWLTTGFRVNFPWIFWETQMASFMALRPRKMVTDWSNSHKGAMNINWEGVKNRAIEKDWIFFLEYHFPGKTGYRSAEVKSICSKVVVPSSLGLFDAWLQMQEETFHAAQR